jgi:prepilin-type N-terminal cleavage/methylation domain-containing protein
MTVRRRRSRPRGQWGMSLIELMVAISLMGAIVAVFGPVMTAALNSGRRVEAQSKNLDELRVAMASIGRDLRSADCIYQPTIPTGSDNAYSDWLTFDSESNNVFNYVEYHVTSGGLLTRELNNDGNVKTVASGLINPGTTFRQWATPRRSIELRLEVQLDAKQGSRQLRSTIAGRNAWRACS